MNNRPTPETDDLVPQFLNAGEIPDVFALCRKLERERDEWAAMCGRYKQERDEALAELSLKCQSVTIASGTISDLLKKNKQLERERDKAMKDAAQLADRLSGLELRTTEELAKMEQALNEWKDMAAKLVNIASYALGEFDVQLTLDQQRTITETMRQYHSLLKKQ
jgi:hypothetical protein